MLQLVPTMDVGYRDCINIKASDFPGTAVVSLGPVHIQYLYFLYGLYNMYIF